MDIQSKTARLNQTVQDLAKQIAATLPKDEKLQALFQNAYVSTATTTTKFLEDGSSYVFTGDIPAMWLRDSSAQVVHYLPFMKEHPILKDLVKGLIARQVFYINIDPYANAFNEAPMESPHVTDITEMTPWLWEKKYEIDSLAYAVWLMNEYVKYSGAADIFTPELRLALLEILHLWEVEQRHENSPYRFERPNPWQPYDTLNNDGKGAPVGYTGMTWSGFRPSDDACTYGYLVPANMFAHVVLEYAANFLEQHYQDTENAARARKLRDDIQKGIETFATVEHEIFGKMYAYETDGLGNYVLMDDANVPSLMSLPWLGYCKNDDPIYLNTRAFILSKENPFYYEGTYAKGIGSPHTPPDHIWHIALSMQGLTAVSMAEKEEMIKTLLNTDAGRMAMHEGFHKDNPADFSREWFAWSDSLFALLVMNTYYFK